ncbi:hypothetical protein M569_00121 [Genlisea aurea]|uniref:Uncharacterized protein n=1 Tax=Genlisea aurea TaxID=192259 RepID=S8EP23_9LAMI|nr:hypothetical protein M569_00121 [Genlisea aurea]
MGVGDQNVEISTPSLISKKTPVHRLHIAIALNMFTDPESAKNDDKELAGSLLTATSPSPADVATRKLSTLPAEGTGTQGILYIQQSVSSSNELIHDEDTIKYFPTLEKRSLYSTKNFRKDLA